MLETSREIGKLPASGAAIEKKRRIASTVRGVPVGTLLTAIFLVVASQVSMGQAIPHANFDSEVHRWCMPWTPMGNVPEKVFWSSASVKSGRTILRNCASRAAEQGEPVGRSWGNEVLFSASKFDAKPSVIRMLIEVGADPNAKSESGLTPLHEAARRGFVDVAGELLRSGADVNATDERERTPLDVAMDETAIRSLLRRLGGICHRHCK